MPTSRTTSPSWLPPSRRSGCSTRSSSRRSRSTGASAWGVLAGGAPPRRAAPALRGRGRQGLDRAHQDRVPRARRGRGRRDRDHGGGERHAGADGPARRVRGVRADDGDRRARRGLHRAPLRRGAAPRDRAAALRAHPSQHPAGRSLEGDLPRRDEGVREPPRPRHAMGGLRGDGRQLPPGLDDPRPAGEGGRQDRLRARPVRRDGVPRGGRADHGGPHH